MMKVLLLTDVPPCTNFTAGIFLDQLISFLPVEDVACFTVLNPALDPIYPEHLLKMEMKTMPKPREDWGNSLGRLGMYRSWLMEKITAWRDNPRLVDEIATFALKVQAEAVWCVLQGQTMIRLARPVAQKLGLPLLTSIWDPPGWWMRANKVHPRISSQVLQEFGAALRSSAATGTASWAMAEDYQQVYGANTIPFLPSLAPALARPPAETLATAGQFTIGMAGQMYAQNEWNALIQALNQADWKIAGRDVRIRLLGRWASLGANHQMFVEFLGWHSQEETIQLLSQADVLYCPYWFEAAFQEEARLSFPSKLTTYLAAGRPVFFHGPQYASPAVFLSGRSAGECCYSLAPEVILASLEKLAVDSAYYQETALNGNKAFLDCLTLPVLQANFLKFIQTVSPKDQGAVENG